MFESSRSSEQLSLLNKQRNNNYNSKLNFIFQNLKNASKSYNKESELFAIGFGDKTSSCSSLDTSLDRSDEFSFSISDQDELRFFLRIWIFEPISLRRPTTNDPFFTDIEAKKLLHYIGQNRYNCNWIEIKMNIFFKNSQGWTDFNKFIIRTTLIM